MDAHQAAVTVLAGTDPAIPKTGDGAVESLRILIAERRSAAKARVQMMNQIHALLITAPAWCGRRSGRSPGNGW